MLDYERLAVSVGEVRESLGAMVAGLVADGFTDEQARELVVAIFTHVPYEEDGDE